jgi:hypothetical protein
MSADGGQGPASSTTPTISQRSKKRCPKRLSEPERKVWIEEHYAALEADDAALEKKREQAGLTVAREAAN